MKLPRLKLRRKKPVEPPKPFSVWGTCDAFPATEEAYRERVFKRRSESRKHYRKLLPETCDKCHGNGWIDDFNREPW